MEGFQPGMPPFVADAAQISYVVGVTQDKLLEARRLGATSRELFDLTTYTLGGGGEAVVVTLNERGDIEWTFTHRTRPAFKVVYSVGYGIQLNDFDEDKRTDASSLMALVPSLQVWLPERSLFGWVEDGVVTTFVTGNKSHYDSSDARFPPRFYPAGLDCWVLEGTTLPQELRRYTTSEDEVDRWHEKFWDYVRQERIVRIPAERIQNLPGDFLAISQNSRMHFLLEQSDQQHPLLVQSQPYHNWHPTEEFAGQRNHLNVDDTRNFMNDWLR